MTGVCLIPRSPALNVTVTRGSWAIAALPGGLTDPRLTSNGLAVKAFFVVSVQALLFPRGLDSRWMTASGRHTAPPHVGLNIDSDAEAAERCAEVAEEPVGGGRLE